MGYGVKYDSLGTPTVEVVGQDLPDMWPADAPWMIVGSGGGTFQPEYSGAMGFVFGSPLAGLGWGAIVMSAGPTDQQQDVADWSVSAALFTADGTPVCPLGCSVLSAKEWTVETPAFGPGEKRIMLISVTARKPGCTTTLRTPVLLLVAGA